MLQWFIYLRLYAQDCIHSNAGRMKCTETFSVREPSANLPETPICSVRNACCPRNLQKKQPVEGPPSGCGVTKCSVTCPEKSNGDSCCSTDESLKPDLLKIEDVRPAYNDAASDIELGHVPTEHVVLKVEGLTCVGCENKLNRTINFHPAVRNLKTSLILSRAEFDFEGTDEKIEELINSIQGQTGFHCERLWLNTHQELELIIQDSPQIAIDYPRPPGVTDVRQVANKTLRIQFDAYSIGARDILQYYSLVSPSLAPAKQDSSLASGKKDVRKTCLITLVSIILTVPVLVLSWAPLSPHEVGYGAVSLALATSVQIFIAGPFYPSAIKGVVFSRVIEMDLLIVLSTSIAYIFSVISYALAVAGRPLATGQFFQTSTLLVTLIMVGRSVSALARQHAVESISIRSMQATMATLVEKDGKDRIVDVRLLQYSDLFKVAPDSRIVTDGVVVFGTSEVDESMMTGESRPVEKSPGSAVVAGSLNGAGALAVRLTRLSNENTVSEIAIMVDEAKFSKAKVQEIADHVAGYFVPVILALALIIFIIWILVGKFVRHGSAGSSAVNALTFAIAVLVVSCPCAIGLAVPMVIVVAGGVAAEHGIIFKSAQAMEKANKVTHVVFDKTGTLTTGKPTVVCDDYFDPTPLDIDQVKSIIHGLVSSSRHPVSAAIVSHLSDRNVVSADVNNVKSITGKGITGIHDKSPVQGGSPHWLGVEEVSTVQSMLERGLTVFCVTLDSNLIAAYGLEDTIHPDTLPVLSMLKSRGLALSIVSGDHSTAVTSVAAKLAISPESTRSQYLPADKRHYVQSLSSKGATVLFLGDGTNDSPALAQADIGVHIGEGTDVARSAADVVLMRPSLQTIPVLLDIAKAAHRRIVLNFAWSFVYNLFAILLAGGAFVRARIPPAYAGLGEVVSVVPVVLIAWQMKWASFRHD